MADELTSFPWIFQGVIFFKVQKIFIENEKMQICLQPLENDLHFFWAGNFAKEKWSIPAF